MRLMWISMAAACFACPALAADVKFPLTGENTKLQFVGSKPDGKHDGGFKTITGTATAGATGLKLDLVIDMDSLYADDPKLTGHLKSADFFEVKNNPTAKFVTTKIEKVGEEFSVTGELTLKGKVKAVTFPAKITLTEEKLTLDAEFRINRNEIGITFGKGKINDEVVIKVSVAAKK
jgi:polyisoprenoid-binding protein YceI